MDPTTRRTPSRRDAPRRIGGALRGFAVDRRGSLLAWFALALVPLVFAVGAGVDYGRSVNVRTRMQNATDAAALAGATLYTGSTASAAATAAATAYMTAFVASMPSAYGITYTVTLTTTTTGSTSTLYNVTVAASATVANSVMRIAGTTSNTVATTSTAENPVYTVTLSLAGFSSSAWDGEAIYYYIVPSDNSAPAATALNLLSITGGSTGTNGSYGCSSSATSSSNGQCSNNGVTTSSKGSTTVTLTASQSIGFALRNVTGGQTSYSSNSYGAPSKSINWFYSNVFPPSLYTYKGVTANRSLQTSTTATQPQTGTTSTSLPAYATLNCAQASGKTISYYWNDMGGYGSDDLDYNDATYTATCAKNSSSGPTGVVLTN